MNSNYLINKQWKIKFGGLYRIADNISRNVRTYSIVNIFNFNNLYKLYYDTCHFFHELKSTIKRSMADQL